MSLKKSMWEYGKTVLRELLKEPEKVDSHKAASLSDLKMEDLQKAKVRLDLAENKSLAEYHELETKGRKFFEEGVKAPSTMEKKVYARKFKEMKSRANNKIVLLDTISVQSQLIDGLLQIKEEKQTLDQIGIGSIVENLELSELSRYVEDATVNGTFNIEKFKDMIGVINSRGIAHQNTADSDVDEILRIMEDAADARNNPELMDKFFENANTTLTTKNKGKEDPFSEVEG